MHEYSMTSPDGKLELRIHAGNGDVVVGFAGGGWHVHLDQIASVYYDFEQHESDFDWAQRFVQDVVNDRFLIEADYEGEQCVRAEVLPPDCFELGLVAEGTPLRYWSGKPHDGGAPPTCG